MRIALLRIYASLSSDHTGLYSMEKSGKVVSLSVWQLSPVWQ